MEFEKWWASLSKREHDLIGLNNARFVWESAQQALKNNLAMAIEKMPFGDTAQAFSTYIRNFK